MANWNFEDFLRRLEALKGLESLDELVQQVPGLGAILEDVDFRLEDLEPIERILRAMSREERLDPELLEGDEGLARRQRIASDSDTSLDAVDSLIWQFRNLCDMLEAMSPEDVTQELLQSAQPQLEPWQTSPDAWKAGAEPITETTAADDPIAREEREMAQLREQVDLLLTKISSLGMEALTASERAFLDQASARFRAAQSR